MNIPNIIKASSLSAKDTPGTVIKKLTKVSPEFAKCHELELHAYWSRSELAFQDKCRLVDECFLSYELMRVFVYRFTDEEILRHLMYEEITLSIPELRKCGVKPYHKLWEHLAEVLCRNAEFINSYEPELDIQEGGYPQMPNLNLLDGEQMTGTVINKFKGIESLFTELADLHVPGDEDEVIYAAETAAAYCIWLQAVVGWTNPLVILKDTFPDGHFTGNVSQSSRSRAKVQRKSKAKNRKRKG